MLITKQFFFKLLLIKIQKVIYFMVGLRTLQHFLDKDLFTNLDILTYKAMIANKFIAKKNQP